jgi:hypothetical protein
LVPATKASKTVTLVVAMTIARIASMLRARWRLRFLKANRT